MASVLETRSDCSRCAALCCIAYPSEEMPGFSAAKQAGQACPKLGSDGLCTIYTRRAEDGSSPTPQGEASVVVTVLGPCLKKASSVKHLSSSSLTP